MNYSFRLSLLLLIMATALLYGPVVGFDFINWDDDYYILRDKHILSGITWQGVYYAFTATKPFLMPLPRLVFMGEVDLYGLFSGGFHLVNLIFHLANIGLVGWLMWSLTGEKWGSLLVAAVFALHPQRVEAVAWVTELKEVMAAFFALLSLLSYHHFICDNKASRRLVSLVFMFFSLLAKPLWVVLPCLLLLLDFWPWQRSAMGWSRLLWEKWPFFLLSVVFSLLTMLGMEKTSSLTGLQELSLWDRLGHGFAAIATYLFAAFFPQDNAIYHPKPQIAWQGLAWAGLALTIIISFSLWRLRNKSVAPLIGWLWFLGLLFPVLGLVTGGMAVLVSDRWTYVSHIGLVWGVVWLIKPWFRPLVGGVVSILFLSYLFLATQETLFHWRDSKTLWSHAISVLGEKPGSDYAHGMLGKYYERQGLHQEALGYFLEAARRKPEFPFYALEVGNGYLRTGRIEDAWHWYNRLAELTNVPAYLVLDVGRLALLNRHYFQVDEFWQRAQPHIHQEYPEELAKLEFYHLLAKVGRGQPVTPWTVTHLTDSQQCQQVIQVLVDMSDQHLPVAGMLAQVRVQCTPFLATNE